VWRRRRVSPNIAFQHLGSVVDLLRVELSQLKINGGGLFSTPNVTFRLFGLLALTGRGGRGGRRRRRSGRHFGLFGFEKDLS